MKKKLSVALLAALLCALLLPVYAQAASYVNTDANGGGWLNMRKSNNTTSTVMAYLKNGSPLSWTGTPDNTTGMREVTGPATPPGGIIVPWQIEPIGLSLALLSQPPVAQDKLSGKI